jgi:alpha-L-fucosidase
MTICLPVAPGQLIRPIDWALDPDYRHASAAAVEAWQDRKYGMRIHWGPYTVLGLEASWPLNRAPKDFRLLYSTLYEVFNPTDFIADEWAALAQRAGMTYFVFTAKHHDGFCMFDTRTKTKAWRRVPGASYGPGIGPVEESFISYSIANAPYKEDIVRELTRAFRKRGLGVGLYYSFIDWNDPNFRWDKPSMYYDPNYSLETDPEGWHLFTQRQGEQLRELATNYGKIDHFSFDGYWPETAWRELIASLKEIRALQPDVVMKGNIGPYGDWTGKEGWEPGDPSGELIGKPWEIIVRLGTCSAYTPNSTYRSKEWLVNTLTDIVAHGGNVMLSIAPMANGRFPQETIERLEYAGDWLRVNGEAIYKTRPWNVIKEGADVRYTRSKDGRYVYAISLKQPGKQLKLTSVRAVEVSKINMLGLRGGLHWRQGPDGLIIDVPETRPSKQACAFRIEAQPYREKYT